MFSSGGNVRIDVGRELVAHVTGIHRCGSSWSCPLCAPVIRRRRAEEIDGAVSRHLAAGGGVELLTQTARHRLEDALVDRLSVLTSSLGLTFDGSGWKRRRDRLSYLGSIKAVEITYGTANGWHPHSHSLLFFARPLSDEERADLSRWIFGRWSKVLTTKLLGSINEKNGVDLRPVGAAGIGDYLNKTDGGWSAGYEIARGDLKSWSPVQLLREAVTTGDVELVALWREYESATFGRASIRWSRGLRALLCGVEEEATDLELAASEGLDLALLRAFVPRETWDAAVRIGEAGRILTKVEQAAAVLLWMGDRLGYDPEPLDIPTPAALIEGIKLWPVNGR